MENNKKAKLILFNGGKKEKEVNIEESDNNKNKEELEGVEIFKNAMIKNKDQDWKVMLIAYTSDLNYLTYSSDIDASDKRVLFGALEELKFELNVALPPKPRE